MKIESTIQLNIEYEEQAGALLCWAAVAVMIAKFYDPSFSLDQKDLAVSVFGNGQYDRVLDPRKALQLTGNFRGFREGPLSLEDVIAELESGRPVAACMRFFIGWHLVILYGIDLEGNLLVADPLHGLSSIDHEAFSNAYLEHYSWTHTCLTQRKGMDE